MIKLLHTADIHIGKKFFDLQEKAGNYRNQLLQTFELIANTAISEEAQILLIAGDLFDSNQVYGNAITRVLEVLKKLEPAGIMVCIMPGYSDSYCENSIYVSLQLPDNVTLLTPENNMKIFADPGISVQGIFSAKDLKVKKVPPQNYRNESEIFCIGIGHCEVEDGTANEEEKLLRISVNEISDSDLDYLALGHRHVYDEISHAGKTLACYCGSPEPLDIYQDRAGDVALVTLHSNREIEIKPIHVGTKKTGTLKIDVTSLRSIDNIIDRIIEMSDPDLILEVTLTGNSYVDFHIDLQELEQKCSTRFFKLRVINQTYPHPQSFKYKEISEQTVLKRFIKIAEEKTASAATPEEKCNYLEVLKQGLNLLNKESEVEK